MFYSKSCLGKDENLSLENEQFKCNILDDKSAFNQSINLLSNNNLIDSKQCLQDTLIEFPLTKYKVDIFYILGHIALMNNEPEEAIDNFLSSYNEDKINFRATMNLFEISKILFDLTQDQKACSVLDMIILRKHELIIERSLLKDINDIYIKKCNLD